MSLEPQPSRRFGANDSQYIVPDMFVYKTRGQYTTPCGKGKLTIVVLWERMHPL
jgi:DNA-directed RNA polymerase specialized sigma54-like protein